MFSRDSILQNRKESEQRINEILTATPHIVGKKEHGVYTVRCLSCSSVFEVKQYNYKCLPKLCSSCSDRGGKCCGCGQSIPFGRLFCSSCLPIMKRDSQYWGHDKQGQAIKGELNPAKRPEVRQKISEGVIASYVRDPELRRSRKGIYRHGKIPFQGLYLRSQFECDVVQYLHENNIPFVYEPCVHIGDKVLFPDFVVDGIIAVEAAGWIVDGFGTTISECLDRYATNAELLLQKFCRVILIVPQEHAGYFLDRLQGKFVTVVTHPVGDQEPVTIFKEGICNVDYSHFLSFHDKACQRVHGHTSWNVGAIVRGFPTGGMVIDYGDLKTIIGEEVKSVLDHRLVISSSYIDNKVGDILQISYSSVQGVHRMDIPVEEVFIMDDEPTCENITSCLAHQVLKRMPPNVVEIGLVMREGNNNGAICFVERPLRQFKYLERIVSYYRKIKGNIQ